MPIVRVDITGPKTSEYRRALLSGVRAAVVEGLGVPDDRVTVRVVETPSECVDAPGCRTEHFTVIEVLLYEGRTEQLKRAMISAVREKLAEDPGIEPSEVAVFVHDASTTDLDVIAGQAGT